MKCSVKYASSLITYTFLVQIFSHTISACTFLLFLFSTAEYEMNFNSQKVRYLAIMVKICNETMQNQDFRVVESITPPPHFDFAKQILVLN